MALFQEILSVFDDAVAKVAHSDVVVGTPIVLSGLTLVPLSRVSVGLGGGGGKGEDPKDKGGAGEGVGGGAGGGANVRPVAVLVFGPDGVEVLAVPDPKGPVERLLDKLPDLIERFQKVS